MMIKISKEKPTGILGELYGGEDRVIFASHHTISHMVCPPKTDEELAELDYFYVGLPSPEPRLKTQRDVELSWYGFFAGHDFYEKDLPYGEFEVYESLEEYLDTVKIDAWRWC